MISCVYCGGAHERPADIKQCWADHQTSGSTQPDATGAGVETRAAPTTLHDRSAEQVSIGVRRGPRPLGRNVVVAVRADPPDDWTGAERIIIDPTGDLRPFVEQLRDRAQQGTGVIIELLDRFDEPPTPVDRRPLHEVGPGHTFLADELHHLVWSNSIDVRRPELPRWRLADRAVAVGADSTDRDEPGDITLPDGRRAWLDGGPVRVHDPIDGVAVLHAVQIEHGRLAVPVGNTTDADLAPDQLAAVTHTGGAARIIAPAGSGKTRVLTERARHLLTQWQLPPGAVSLVAFNKRAQEEMKERTADLPGLQVRTLNSIALAVLNGTPPFAPQQRRWRTIDEPDVRNILGRFVSFPRRRNTDPLSPWLDALSLVRLGLVDPAEVESRYDGDVEGLADVWPKYRSALDRDGVVDFDDQIARAIEVLLTQPRARRAAQRACRVLLVDEFQDLTPAHLLLIRLLAAPGGAVFGVGDDDQTIYGYNGADPGWLIDFAQWFPGSGDHPLEINYRCPGGVVAAADRLLRHNRRRIAKTIRAASDDPRGWSATASDDPVGATLTAVRDVLADGVTPAEIAVLSRVNATIAPVQVALAAADVPISGGVGTEFADRTAVRAALAWLRLAVGGAFAPADLAEALRRPSRPLHPRIAEWVGEQRDTEALLRLVDRLTNEKDASRVAEFASDIGRLRAMVAAGTTTRALIDVLVDEIGLGGAVATLDQSRRGMNRSAQGDDLLAVRQLARLHDDPGSFEPWLREHLSVRRDRDGVVLATVHRVKGQEWPNVIVHLADHDQYPHRLADDHEEERRLFHVAITRASRAATIVSGEHPSPFIGELTSEPPEHPPEPPSRPRREAVAPAKRRSGASDHPLLVRDRVLAVVGIVLVDQGHEWTVTDLEPEAAVAERDGATRKFKIGSKVQTAGKQRGRLAARPGEVAEGSALVFDLLRRFRDGARDGKPAYTVFDDKTLAAIADALPNDLADLARVKGVGPAKLEQYGDDVLALVAAVLRG